MDVLSTRVEREKLQAELRDPDFEAWAREREHVNFLRSLGEVGIDSPVRTKFRKPEVVQAPVLQEVELDDIRRRPLDDLLDVAGYTVAPPPDLDVEGIVSAGATADREPALDDQSETLSDGKNMERGDDDLDNSSRYTDTNVADVEDLYIDIPTSESASAVGEPANTKSMVDPHIDGTGAAVSNQTMPEDPPTASQTPQLARSVLASAPDPLLTSGTESDWDITMPQNRPNTLPHLGPSVEIISDTASPGLPSLDPTMPQNRPDSSSTGTVSTQARVQDSVDPRVLSPLASSSSQPGRQPAVSHRSTHIHTNPTGPSHTVPNISTKPLHTEQASEFSEAPSQARLLMLRHHERLEDLAERRGGFARINFKEFEEWVGRSGNKLDYLGAWIDMCIP